MGVGFQISATLGGSMSLGFGVSPTSSSTLCFMVEIKDVTLSFLFQPSRLLL